GDVDQRRRLAILSDFREGRLPILVATDVASRGLHIEGVTHVFNYDLPFDAEDYVHRVGRTARAGASGRAVSLACEEYVDGLEAIEQFIGFKLPWEIPEDAMLAHPLHHPPRERGEHRRPHGRPQPPPRAEAAPKRRRRRGRRGGGATRPDRWLELAMIEGIRELPTPRRQLVHKPVIAAVNGVVDGFALDLVTEADIPIASDGATFVDPHVSLGYVSSHEMVNMARRVPVAVCLRMALLGSRERMSAQRAYEVGLVTEVVPHARLMERARELAAMVVSNAPLAVWGTKMGIL